MDYQKIYDKICSRAKSQKRLKGKGVYYEAHHILPKCLGGEGKVSQYKTHPNIVLLTDKEHFLAHRLLCKIYPQSKKLRGAWWAMCNQVGPNQERVYRASARAYSEAKSLFIMSYSGKNHPNYGQGWKQLGDKNPSFGRFVSEEERKDKSIKSKMAWSDPVLIKSQSLRHKGRKDSEKTKLKKQKPKSEEHKNNIRKSLTGVSHSEERNNKNPFRTENPSSIKFFCGVCNREIGGIGNFKKHNKTKHLHTL